MKEPLELICLPISNQQDSNGIAISFQSDLYQFVDTVFLHKQNYEKLFGKKSSKQSNYWHPQIVNVTYGDRSIYRRALISTNKGLDTKVVAMTYNSIGELTNFSKHETCMRPVDDIVIISKGSALAFWRLHLLSRHLH